MINHNAKLAGITGGIFADIIFLVLLISVSINGNSHALRIVVPFIPLIAELNILTVIAGVVFSFVWGFVLVYLFALTYFFYSVKLKD